MSQISIVKIVDRFGSLLCAFIGLFTKKKKIAPYKSILCIQLWSIGETILTLPAISTLGKVSVLATTRNKEVFSAAKLPIKIYTLPLNPVGIIIFAIKNWRKFDLVIDFEEYLNISAIVAFILGKQRIGFSHKLRSKLYNKTIVYNDNQHVSKTFQDLTNLISSKAVKFKKLHYSKKSLKKIKNILPKGKIIGIVPGAAESAKSRMWPIANYQKLTRKLVSRRNCSIVFIGSAEEKRVVQKIISECKNTNIVDTTGKLSVQELFCLVDNLDLLITNDTGPLHIASAQNTPTIALYGPNTPVRFGPTAKKSIAIYKPKSCKYSPCINVHRGMVPDCLYAKNSKDYQKCMKAISVEEVIVAINKVF